MSGIGPLGHVNLYALIDQPLGQIMGQIKAMEAVLTMDNNMSP